MKLYKYTLVELKDAVASSYSIRQSLQKLGVATYGGNYDVFKRAVKYFDIDTSHFRGKGWSRGLSRGNKRQLSEYLVKDGPYNLSSHKIRLRLLSENVFLHQCSNCQRTEWNDNPIPLELHHINGDKRDHRIENLLLLCPNCHSQTPSFRGKNKKT